MTTPDQTSTSPASLPLIAFTGGGSAGHVTPNLALIDEWSRAGGRAVYFGRAQSIEEDLLASVPNVPFITVPSERLRRYFHWANFIMPLIVLVGIARAAWMLRRHRPRVLFSKGGFVALPVVIGAWLNRIPVVIHESDGSLGLANRLSLPFTRVVCVAQPRAAKRVKHRDVRVTGAPLRRDFIEASPEEATRRFGLEGARPLLVVFGGSQGARRINEAAWSALDELLRRYEVLHVVGPQHRDEAYDERYGDQGYHQHEYIKEGFADLLAGARIVVGRAGANAIAELLALRKPALLIPLPSASSRGDQALNAQEFVELGGGVSLEDQELDGESLVAQLTALESRYAEHQGALTSAPFSRAGDQLIELFTQLAST